MYPLALVMLMLALEGLQASRMTIGKHTNGEGAKSGGLEVWQKELCVVFEGTILKQVPRADKGTSKDETSCKKAIEDEDKYCTSKDTGKIGGKSLSLFDPRCRQYKKQRAIVERQVKERVATGTIKVAVEACEPEVENVCVTSSCPTMCYAKNISEEACKCKEFCDGTLKNMWATGSINCTDKPFSECQDDLAASLKEAGRHKELEALMRELTLKCICVAWRKADTRDICYAGGKGIKAGTRWCDFYDTGSWMKMLENKGIDAAEMEERMKDAEFKPSCTEIPGPHGKAEMAEMGANCGWAAPSASPFGLKTVLGGVLMLLASVRC